MSIGRRSHDRAERERGGVAVTVVAFFLGSSVILGMLAISVDLGNLTYERRQVQNGADATSLALASECAADASNCDPDLVEDLLGANSHDAAGRYRTDRYTPGVCARGTAEQVGPLDGVECVTTGDITDLAECPELPDWLATSTIPYVETYAATETGDGNSELFLPFSRALTGASGDAGTSACARVAWGPPGGTGATLPLTISECDWAKKTAVQGYAPSPPYTPVGDGDAPPPVPSEITDGGYATGIFAHDSAGTKCTGSPGLEYPGGFAWLEDSEDCVANVENGWVDGDTGSGPCVAEELKKYLGTEVFIPIHVDHDGTGAGGKYEISGVASFYLAGWHGLSSAAPTKTYGIYQEPAGVCTDPKCGTGSVAYVWGWFTSGQLPVGSIDPDADDFGAVAIQPAG